MQVSIIGCGWLGLPLGSSLASKGYTVKGSTTHSEKLPHLKKAGITPYLFELVPMPAGKEFNRLFQTDLLFVNIPPGRKRNRPEFYEEQIKYLSYLINQHQVPRVIFVSSTSYYPNTNDWVDTQTPYDFTNGSSRAVVQAEKQVAKINAELLILRCGGLMGGERIPGRWFSGKETSGATTPVNYIHRDDVIHVVETLISQKTWDQPIMNLVCPEHPSRQLVHKAMAKKYNFAPPVWQAPELTAHKLVKSDFNDFKLKYASPLEF